MRRHSGSRESLPPLRIKRPTYTDSYLSFFTLFGVAWFLRL
jgi:hypothetical protein